jgi:hypothetical protein
VSADNLLPLELVWQDDGHVSEVALAAIADGELEIVPDQAARHVGACDDCTARLGEQALFSLATDEALSLAHPAAERAALRRPLPVAAICTALVLAAIGSAPALIGVLADIGSAPHLALRGLLLGTRTLSALVRAAAAADAGVWAVAWCAATAVLLGLGALIARAATERKETA